MLADIGGLYGPVVDMFGAAMPLMFRQTTEGKILQGSMNIEIMKKKNDSKGNHTKVVRTSKTPQLSSEAKIATGQNSINNSKQESKAEKDHPLWPTQTVSDNKFEN